MTLQKEGLRENGLRNLSIGVFGDDLVHIETVTASGDSTIDFTNVFTSEYSRYVLFIDNLIVSLNTDRPEYQLSSDGGNTWDSGSSDYAHSGFSVKDDGSTESFGSSGQDYIQFDRQGYGADVSSNDTSGHSITISDPSNPNRATVLRQNHSRYEGGKLWSNIAGGIRLEQSAVDSIRIQIPNESFDGGIFSVYGVDQ